MGIEAGITGLLGGLTGGAEGGGLLSGLGSLFGIGKAADTGLGALEGLLGGAGGGFGDLAKGGLDAITGAGQAVGDAAAAIEKPVAEAATSAGKALTPTAASPLDPTSAPGKLNVGSGLGGFAQDYKGAQAGMGTFPSQVGAGGGGAAAGGAKDATKGASEFALPGFLGGLTKNPSNLLALGGAGATLLGGGNKNPAGFDPLMGQAAGLAGQGAANQAYLQTGQLPPGVQASLDQNKAQGEAAIRGNYAARGQSGSSAEIADLNALHTQVAGQGADIASKLLETGLKETGMANELYMKLMQQQMEQDKGLSDSWSNLLGALGGLLGGGSRRAA